MCIDTSDPDLKDPDPNPGERWQHGGMSPSPALRTWLGEVDYATALGWQERLVAARQEGVIDDVLLLLTHPPVYTAGRHADVAANRRDAHPEIPVVRIDRGGDLTYHGPGQVVAYPIVALDGATAARRHVDRLESALIATAGSFGVAAARREGYPGVWVGTDKLAAIGVRITRRVSKHGVALNVDPDMGHFDGIIPCGIRDGGVTSLARLGVDAAVEEVAERLGAALADALDLRARRVSPAELGLHAPAR